MRTEVQQVNSQPGAVVNPLPSGLFDSLNVGIALLDSEHRFVYYNSSFNRFLCSQTGLDLNTTDLIGQSFPLESFWEAQPAEPGISWQLESPGGDYSLSGQQLLDNDTLKQFVSETQYLLQVTAVAKNKPGEPELASAITLGQGNEKEKLELLSSFSHEFRTPLNAVMGFGNLLLDDVEKPEHREYVQGIVSAGSHLLKLVNEILTLSKAEYESTEISLRTENIDVDEVIAECVALMQPMAANANVTVVQSGSSGRLICDRTRLRQVLLNLLSNAIKYNEENGQVVVRGLAIGNRCAGIEVQDNGLGIPASLSETIFNPFRRLLTSGVRKEGSGLGLMLTRRLVNLMGGRVRLASQAGTGSVFAVDFNLEDEMAGTAGIDRKTVLLLCANPSQRSFASELLELRPAIDVISSSSLPLASLGNQEFEPDLVIVASDVLQAMEIEELAMLKNLLAQCPGVGLVPESDSEGVRMLIELGVIKRLALAFDPIEFLAMLDNVSRKPA